MSRETLMMLLSTMDPEDTESRKKVRSKGESIVVRSLRRVHLLLVK